MNVENLINNLINLNNLTIDELEEVKKEIYKSLKIFVFLYHVELNRIENELKLRRNLH